MAAAAGRPVAAACLVSQAGGDRPARAGIRIWPVAAPMLNFSFVEAGAAAEGACSEGARRPAGRAAQDRAGRRAGPPQPPDQVALMTQRLQSFYSSNRKEAAYTLGRLHDPRAIPSLIHVLKYDSSKDVRIASAIALGEIGGSESAVALERCAIYDQKEEVRKAAATALERLNAQAKNAAADLVAGRHRRPRRPAPR